MDPKGASQTESLPLAAGPNHVLSETRVDEAHFNGALLKIGQLIASLESTDPSPANPHGNPSHDPPRPSGLPQNLLAHHAEDLILQLQRTAESLDVRESQLNAKIALHERQERQFRMWSESQRTAIDELVNETKRLLVNMQKDARRIAMTQANF